MAQKHGVHNIDLVCDAVVTIAASADGDDASVGAHPRFKMLAYSGAPMRLSGWRHPVVVDLSGLSIPSQRRPVRCGHSAAAGVGHTERIAVEDGRLIAEGVVSRDTPEAREVVTSGKRGFPWQASIGASVHDVEFVRAGVAVQVNGRTIEGPVYVVRRAVLGEISFVDLGADGTTEARIAARGEMNDEKIEQTDGAVQAQEVPDIEAMRAAAVAETHRIADIRKICGGQHPDIEARAISEGWSAERAELEVLRASRPVAPAVHTGVQALTCDVLEAACAQTAGLSQIEQHYDTKTLEAADRRFRGRIGLQELLLEAAWANGYTGRTFRDLHAVLRSAFHRDIQAAGTSTIDIGGILSNVANKFLLEGFFSVERSWRDICAVRNVSDFKTVTSYRLIGKDQYELVAPGGELKHGTLAETSFTNKADTYGLMLSIDRRDIINDDLGALTTVPRKLGRGSGLKINDVFWATFMNNAAFFTPGNKNYLAGADTVLSVDGLTKAEVAFLDQVDPDGKPLGAMPAIMLVPTALSAIGTMLFKATEIRDTYSQSTGSAKYPTINPHSGKYRVVVSRYLGNTVYAGASSKAWYLLADPSDLPVIEVAFLNGQEAPTIETAEANFNVLGVQMRGYHDFGVALQDPKGGVKCKGEA